MPPKRSVSSLTPRGGAKAATAAGGDPADDEVSQQTQQRQEHYQHQQPQRERQEQRAVTALMIGSTLRMFVRKHTDFHTIKAPIQGLLGFCWG